MRAKKSRERRPPRSASTSAEAAPAQGYRLETPLICVFLVFAAFIAFGESCGKDFEFFNFDDDEYITQNPHVQAGLTANSIAWTFTTLHSGNWHPLTWMSLQLDYMLFGTEPWG